MADRAIPLGLLYLAEDALHPQAVYLPSNPGEKLVVVGEPNHNAAQQWRDLQTFMEKEGIPAWRELSRYSLYRTRPTTLPAGIRALAWQHGKSVILYFDSGLTRESRDDAVGRVLLALQLRRFGRRAQPPAEERHLHLIPFEGRRQP